MLALSEEINKPRRIVEPEILDHLPPTHPAAIRSRGDLRLVNALMGNERWILRQLSQLDLNTTGNNYELGAGDGSLGKKIATRQHTKIHALDFAPRSKNWPNTWPWSQTDILAFAEKKPPADLVIANLILHHFQDHQLQQLGHWLSTAKTIIAVEPHRARLPHALAYAMRLLDINYVTREDIHTSIRAGFTANELPSFLGLKNADWNIQVTTTPLGAYRMIAQRK